MTRTRSLDRPRITGLRRGTRWLATVVLAAALTPVGISVATANAAPVAPAPTLAAPATNSTAVAAAAPAPTAPWFTVTQAVTATTAATVNVPNSSTNSISLKNTGGTALNGIQIAVLIDRNTVDGQRGQVRLSNSNSAINTSCQQFAAPPGYTELFVCRYVERTSTVGAVAERYLGLSRGATWTVRFDISGDSGSTFTSTVSGTGGGVALQDIPASELYSPIGPGADLSHILTKSNAPTGSLPVQASITNAGPVAAVGEKILFQVKAGAPITGALTSTSQRATCTSATPTAGYVFALACTRADSAAVGMLGRWDLTVTFKASARGTIQVDSTVSATSPIDPVPDNNAASLSVTF